ncbi:hypothetical protein [Streptomyces sporangiiformans]|uniref:Carboxypeptidase regulatory-like domain-containing protein n=1 Tax=Streptomyces sporangiiformans TaxID=2315329 RepID=A0A505D3Z3_9ACTN|nr:hypothetical protein [Streptomyces sporangiiformans]TPQ18404.1 hypothetical protein FGD71_031130 [Streptomyces sporangiiformans]
MSSLRLTLCAGAVVATALGPVSLPLPAPAAYASDTGVSVTPSFPTPGTDVWLRVRGCEGKSATAKSKAFVAPAQLVGKGGLLFGETRVRSRLTPGAYDVKVICGDFEERAKIRGTITVVPDKHTHKPTHRPEPRPEPDHEHESESDEDVWAPASPVAPVRAGGGGTAQLSAVEDRSEGPGTWHAVVGLVLAGVAAVAVAVRSARRGRGGGTD